MEEPETINVLCLGVKAMNFNFSDFFWIFLAVLSFLPGLQKRQMETRRVQTLQAFEQQRRSRVILLIHRQESISLLGIPSIAIHLN
jgi:ClpP class serine protease